MADSGSGASMRPIDRFVEQFQRRDLRAHYLRENRIHPRDLDGWAYPSEEQVREAEKAIGKSLPPSYKHLVRNFHPGELPFDFYWIGGVGTCWVDGIEVRLMDLVEIAGPATSFLIPLMSVGDCDEVCFDTRRADADGEYPLVHWDAAIHGSDPHPGVEFEVWAGNLGELLLGQIDRLPHVGA